MNLFSVLVHMTGFSKHNHNLQLLFLCRGVLGHFAGQRLWYPIEDIVNKQSGVVVGELFSCV